jgi:hypothetical protein
MRDIRVFVDRKPWTDGFDFLIVERTQSGRVYAEVVMHEVAEGGEVFAPSFVLPTAAAQELIDGLWQAGLRPSEGTGSAGALAATQKHLEDMRRLVFERKAHE